jgi:hypothetical protein
LKKFTDLKSIQDYNNQLLDYKSRQGINDAKIHTCIKVDYELKKRNNLGGIIDLRELSNSPKNKDSAGTYSNDTFSPLNKDASDEQPRQLK